MSDRDANIEKALSYLARFRDAGVRNRIGGADTGGELGVFDTISPIDGETLAAVARGGPADIDRAA